MEEINWNQPGSSGAIMNEQYNNRNTQQPNNAPNNTSNSNNVPPPMPSQRQKEESVLKVQNDNVSQKYDIMDTRITNIQQPTSSELDRIKIDTGEVLAKANAMSTLNSEIEELYSTLVTKMNNLENYWSGEASNNANTAFQTIKENEQSRKTELNNYINFLKQTVVPGYEETETTNSSLADSFK